MELLLDFGAEAVVLGDLQGNFFQVAIESQARSQDEAAENNHEDVPAPLESVDYQVSQQQESHVPRLIVPMKMVVAVGCLRASMFYADLCYNYICTRMARS